MNEAERESRLRKCTLELVYFVFGNPTYTKLVQFLAEAEQDPEAKEAQDG